MLFLAINESLNKDELEENALEAQRAAGRTFSGDGAGGWVLTAEASGAGFPAGPDGAHPETLTQLRLSHSPPRQRTGLD